jgi:hypothetical protein
MLPPRRHRSAKKNGAAHRRLAAMSTLLGNRLTIVGPAKCCHLKPGLKWNSVLVMAVSQLIVFSG